MRYEEQRAQNTGSNLGRGREEQSENIVKVVKSLDAIAKKKGTATASVALAYVMHKTPCVFPIVGGRKLEHLKGNIEALSLQLSEEEMDDIEGAAEFDLGFPLNMLRKGERDSWMNKIEGEVDYVVPSKVSFLGS